MIGEVFNEVKQNGDDLLFISDKQIFKFHHIQNCCENVELEDICGDLDDLVGSPIVMAAEETDGIEPYDPYEDSTYEDSYTWTFYKFATIKGYVTVRWLGTSNGYYSESVRLDIIEGD